MPQVEVQLETNWSAKGISQPLQTGVCKFSSFVGTWYWTVPENVLLASTVPFGLFGDLWKTFATQLSGIECRRDGSLRWWLTPLSRDPSQGICRDCSHFSGATSQFAIHSDDGHGTAEKADMDIVDMGLLRIGVLLAKARLSEREGLLTWTVDTAAEKAAGHGIDFGCTLLLFCNRKSTLY